MDTEDQRTRRRWSPLRRGDPRQVGRYRLQGRLGEGGMGVVYLGHSPTGDRVAVKVIRVEIAQDPEFRTRFRREVAAARRVAPYCTAPVLDNDPDAERPYLVTEYVDGPSLQQQVAEHGPLPAWQVEGLAVATAHALEAIHRARVVHCDFKPGNVLLSPVGPRVIDFGIAAAAGEATVPGRRFGTPAYMAPEQQANTSVSAAADVWAWAATAVFAATGRTPFGPVDAGLAERLRRGIPDLDGIDGRLRPVLEVALAVDPHARPTAAQLLERLSRQLQTPLPLSEPDSVRPYLGRTWWDAGLTPATAAGGGVRTAATEALQDGQAELGGPARRRRRAPRSASDPWVPAAGGRWLLRLVSYDQGRQLRALRAQLDALRLLQDGDEHHGRQALWALLNRPTTSAQAAAWVGTVLGNHYRTCDEPELAAEAYQRITRRGDGCFGALALLSLGHLRWAQGQFDQAAACYRQARVATTPRCPDRDHRGLAADADGYLLQVLEKRNRRVSHAPAPLRPGPLPYPYTDLAAHASKYWFWATDAMLLLTLPVAWNPIPWLLALISLVSAGASIARFCWLAELDRQTFDHEAVQGSATGAATFLALGAIVLLVALGAQLT